MKGILLDVEGTTTPIRFVTEVLFPFARERLADEVERHIDSAAFRAEYERFRDEHAADDRSGLAPPAWSETDRSERIRSVVAYAHWLMDRDRKSTALKAIQGMTWQAGYGSGALRGDVFADVPEALERWLHRGLDVRIFSSGSVLAQRLLFSTTEAGDLTRFLSGYFDTTTGSKAAPESYARIADAYGVPCGSILFLSDVTAELDAASAAGMDTALCVRPGNPPQGGHSHRIVTSFAAL